MLIPEISYNISSPDEAFKASLSRLNILLDELRSNFTKSIEGLQSDLNKGQERMVAQLYEQNQTMLQNPKLQMQPQALPVSDLSLSKVTSQNIFVSAKTKPSKYDPSSFWTPTQLTKLDHLRQLIPLPCKIVVKSGLGGVAEDKNLTITQLTSEDSISKSETSCLRNPTQVIKVSSCQQLNIPKSETSPLWTKTRFATPLSCDLKPDITKPNSRKISVSAKTKPSNSHPSIFLKLTQLTKVAQFHQLVRKFHRIMPQTWHIVSAEGLGTGRSIICIFHRPHVTDSSRRNFENPKSIWA